MFDISTELILLVSLPVPVDGGSRSLATSIFYLLTHDDPDGVLHMNKSVVR